MPCGAVLVWGCSGAGASVCSITASCAASRISRFCSRIIGGTENTGASCVAEILASDVAAMWTICILTLSGISES